MKRFRAESMLEIRRCLEASLAEKHPGEILTFEAPNPDEQTNLFDGERFISQSEHLRFRGLAAWLEVAGLLGCELLLPETVESPFVRFHFRILDSKRNWHNAAAEDPSEKYGTATDYTRIDKAEDPWFLTSFTTALQTIAPRKHDRVLELGANRGNTLALIQNLLPPETTLDYLGIDHARSAIEAAKQRFPQARFQVADLNDEDAIPNETYHLLIAIATLHGPGLNGKDLFVRLVKHHLETRAGVILSFPNTRYVETRPQFGALQRNYREVEHAHAIQNLGFYRRYLHKKGFRVRVTGKGEWLLFACRSE